MTSVQVDVVRQYRHREQLDHIDYLRSLRRLWDESDMTQVELAHELGITQPAVSQQLKVALKLLDPLEGFSGATAYEVAQRYAAGEISRDQVVDQLSRWTYEPRPKTAGVLDDLLPEVEGTFEDVGRALDDHLIDADLYDEVLHAVAAGRESAAT
jgi:hypothetical protein